MRCLSRIALCWAAFAIFLLTAVGAHAFKPFTFAAIADPHISLAAKHSPENGGKLFKSSRKLLASTVKDINRRGVDFVVVLGDLTVDAAPWNLDLFMETMEHLDAPWYAVIGNHDLSKPYTMAKKREPGMSRTSTIWALQGHGFNGPSRHWALTLPQGVRLIGVDTSKVGDWRGYLGPAGVTHLRKSLSGSDEPAIVLTHHMLVGPSAPVGSKQYGRMTIENEPAARKVFQEHSGPVLHLSGHRHMSTRYYTAGNVLSFNCPSTVSWPMRYVVYTVSQDGVRWETFDVPSSPELKAEGRHHTLKWVARSWTRRDGETDEELLARGEATILNERGLKGRLEWPGR